MIIVTRPLRAPGFKRIIAFCDGAEAGHAEVYNDGLLQNFRVYAPYRRLGYGHRIMQVAIRHGARWLQAHATRYYDEIGAPPAMSQRDLVSFYERHGFKVLVELPDSWRMVRQ